MGAAADPAEAVAAALLCTVAAAAVTLACTANFITPLYRASVMIYVNNVKSSQQVDYISASNLATSQQLVNTYVNIIQSDTVLEKVARSTDTDYTAAQIRAMMTAEQVDETELFFVYITHRTPGWRRRSPTPWQRWRPGRSRALWRAAPRRSSTTPRCPPGGTPPATGKTPCWAPRAGFSWPPPMWR